MIRNRFYFILVMGLCGILTSQSAFSQESTALGVEGLGIEASVDENGALSLNYKGASLINVLDSLSEVSKINFVAGSEIAKREVNMSLEGVTLDQALQSISNGSNVTYDYIAESNIKEEIGKDGWLFAGAYFMKMIHLQQSAQSALDINFSATSGSESASESPYMKTNKETALKYIAGTLGAKDGVTTESQMDVAQTSAAGLGAENNDFGGGAWLSQKLVGLVAFNGIFEAPQTLDENINSNISKTNNINIDKSISIKDWLDKSIATIFQANSFAEFLEQEVDKKDRMLVKNLFEYLDLFSDEKIPVFVRCSADVLQHLVERKLALKPDDRDMIVMVHEIESASGNQQTAFRSTLIVKGEDSLRTAMAKTVGLPLGIAAKLILNGKIKLKGLHIPTRKEIYLPVLKELESYGIIFHDEKITR